MLAEFYLSTFQENFPHMFDPAYMYPNMMNVVMAFGIGIFVLWYIDHHLDAGVDWFMRIHGKE